MRWIDGLQVLIAIDLHRVVGAGCEERHQQGE